MESRFKIKLKKIGAFLCVCMAMLLLPMSALAAPADERELELHYPYEGVNFCFYKIASFDEQEGFELEKPFTDYADSIEGLDHLGELNSDEWRVLAYTLENLVGADNIKPIKELVTDENGSLIWKDIPKGLYLILGDRYETEDKMHTPSSILINVPSYDEKGEWNYQVKVEHNKIKEDDKAKFFDIPVIKIWLDENDKGGIRPVSIKVGLYKDEVLYDTVELSVENNWRHRWEKLPADGTWTIKEIEVPKGYKVRYEQNGYEIAIYNKHIPDIPEIPNIPQTGQLWWPVPILIAVGLLMFTLGWIRNADGEER